VTLDNVTITDDQLGHIAGPVRHQVRV
jgi:hypothetical protein